MKKILNVVFALMFVAGFLLLTYPTISDQWNTYRQNQLISSYEETVSTMEPEDFSEEWEKARAFNDTLTENNIYGDVFTIPEAYIGKVGAKIMSLQDPVKKMSKSDENPNASIYLMDDPDTIMRKCKRAVTDSEAQILYRDEQPGVKNLINIYSACTGKTPEEVVKEFDGRGYGDFKVAVGESVVSVLKPLQEEAARLTKDKAYIDGIIKENAEKAGYYANKTLRKVQKKVGFPERIR